MLSPQAIQQIKSMSAPSAGVGGSSPTATYATPEQAKASFSPIQKTDNSIGAQLKSVYDNSSFPSIVGAAKSGIGQIKEGFNQSMSASGNAQNPIPNPAQMIGGVTKSLAGVVNTAFSPLAPITKPIGDVINQTGEAIGSIPAVEKFANSPTGNVVSGGVDFVNDLNTVVGGVAGGMQAREGLLPSKSTPIKEVPPAPKNPPIDTLVRESGQVPFEKAQSLAWNDIQPKQTPTTKLAYAKGQNTKAQGALTPGEIKPSPADAKLLDSYGKLYEDGSIKEGMTPQDKQAVVSQKAAQLNQQQKEFLATHDKAVTLSDVKGKTGLFDVLDSTSKKSSMPFSKDPSTKGAYDSVIETYKSLLSTGKSAGTVKGASTLTKIDSALSALDSEMEKFGAWGKTKTGEMTETGMARQQAIRDIHSTVRDYIGNQLPKNSPWKAIRLEESNMYQIGDRLAQRSADTVGTSQVGTAIKNNPIIKAGIQGAGLGAGIHFIP